VNNILNDLIQELNNGIKTEDFHIYIGNQSRGRTNEETRLELHVRENGVEDRLLFLKVFFGHPPHLRPWIELFGINPQLELRDDYEYFDSTLEELLLELLSSGLMGGGKIYIEYQEDRETAYGLQFDFPVPATRLGYTLFGLGFTWFKDWYFPEGGSEGAQKLQGEKPLDDKARRRQTELLMDDIGNFVEKRGRKISAETNDPFLLRGLERAERLLAAKSI
jgi:hypothetical protein